MTRCLLACSHDTSVHYHVRLSEESAVVVVFALDSSSLLDRITSEWQSRLRSLLRSFEHAPHRLDHVTRELNQAEETAVGSVVVVIVLVVVDFVVSACIIPFFLFLELASATPTSYEVNALQMWSDSGMVYVLRASLAREDLCVLRG